MSTRLMNIDIQVEHSLTLFYTRYRFRDSIIEKKKRMDMILQANYFFTVFPLIVEHEA